MLTKWSRNMTDDVLLTPSSDSKKINYNCFFSVVAMIAYMTHVFDELIGSPRANHYLAIVAYRLI